MILQVKRITYEEVINDATMQHLNDLYQQKKGLDLNGSRSILKRVDILSIWLRLTEKSEK